MRLSTLLLLVCVSAAYGAGSANWRANYPPCHRHSELLSQQHMDLGVRFSTANPVLARQFRDAMDLWASLLDLDWHEDNTENCSIQLVDGERGLFQPAAIAARSQFPDRSGFQGWIAFNSRKTFSEAELFRISVHEIGHMLGLQHSSNAKSVMYSLELDGQEWLDPADLTALAKHHKLRIVSLDKAINIDRTQRPSQSAAGN